MQQGPATRTSQASISAALAVAAANAATNAPAAERGISLADMAQRDLDAALQLLADRAQYITGSSGAAIALRRGGKNDMLCRASAGSNAPELGALLSTEFGLSGESVRTRQVLRCDDIERDARVNREACRQLGIASVAIMPVVHDEEVLGVFELFSGKVNAFGERDLTALKRLSEMVETAVKLSRAAERVPGSLNSDALAHDPLAELDPAAGIAANAEDPVLQLDAEFVADIVLPQQSAIIQPTPAAPSTAVAQDCPVPVSPDPPKVQAPAEKPATPEPAPGIANRPLLWSIALESNSNAVPKLEQESVPATLRNLRKCEACGFPVSPGRTFCVECEEKKWRGQLKPSRPSAVASSGATAAAAVAPARDREPSARAVTAAAVTETRSPQKNPKPAARAETPTLSEPVALPVTASRAPAPEPELVLTAAMKPSQSWVAAHKFILLGLLAAGAVTAVVLLR